MKSIEQQLAEAQTEIKRLRELVGEKSATLKKVQESGLPPIAQERVLKRLASQDADVDKTIAEERAYLGKIRGSKGSRPVEIEESDSRNGVVEAYKAAGLTEKEATLAAGLEAAVQDLSESEKKFFDAAKSIGMDDAAASIFATHRGRF